MNVKRKSLRDLDFDLFASHNLKEINPNRKLRLNLITKYFVCLLFTDLDCCLVSSQKKVSKINKRHLHHLRPATTATSLISANRSLMQIVSRGSFCECFLIKFYSSRRLSIVKRNGSRCCAVTGRQIALWLMKTLIVKWNIWMAFAWTQARVEWTKSETGSCQRLMMVQFSLDFRLDPTCW